MPRIDIYSNTAKSAAPSSASSPSTPKTTSGISPDVVKAMQQFQNLQAIRANSGELPKIIRDMKYLQTLQQRSAQEEARRYQASKRAEASDWTTYMSRQRQRQTIETRQERQRLQTHRREKQIEAENWQFHLRREQNEKNRPGFFGRMFGGGRGRGGRGGGGGGGGLSGLGGAFMGGGGLRGLARGLPGIGMGLVAADAAYQVAKDLVLAPLLPGQVNKAFQNLTAPYTSARMGAAALGRSNGFNSQALYDRLVPGQTGTPVSWMRKYGLGAEDVISSLSQAGPTGGDGGFDLVFKNQVSTNGNQKQGRIMELAQVLAGQKYSAGFSGLPDGTVENVRRQMVGSGMFGQDSATINNTQSWGDSVGKVLEDATRKGSDKSQVLGNIQSTLEGIQKSGATVMNGVSTLGLVHTLLSAGTPGGLSGDTASSMVQANSAANANLFANPTRTFALTAEAQKYNGLKTDADIKKFIGSDSYKNNPTSSLMVADAKAAFNQGNVPFGVNLLTKAGLIDVDQSMALAADALRGQVPDNMLATAIAGATGQPVPDVYAYLASHQAQGGPGGSGTLGLIGQLENGPYNGKANNKGAIGHYQITGATADTNHFDRKRLGDPAYNEWAANQLINKYNTRYAGNQDEVLVAYNAGPGAADDYHMSGDNAAILPDETQKYLIRAHKLRAQNSVQYSDADGDTNNPQDIQNQRADSDNQEVGGARNIFYELAPTVAAFNNSARAAAQALAALAGNGDNLSTSLLKPTAMVPHNNRSGPNNNRSAIARHQR